MKYRLLALLLALVASSATLLLIESPLKYALYVFQVTLILILFYSISETTAKIKLKPVGNTKIKLDYAFVAISTMQLVFTAIKLDSVLTMIFAIIVSFFLPGYVLLRLLKFRSLESWIEWLTLSFALSIGLTSIIFTAMLPFTTHRAVLLSVIYVGISLFPLLRDRIYKSGEKQEVSLENRIKEYDLSDVLLFLWITVFFVFAISSLYPQMSLRLGLDIVEHFSSSKLLTLCPSVYSSPYPWFHMTWANVYELSNPPMEIFQTGLAYLSLMVIFSFYIMAKAYLKDIKETAPILATVFFSVFSGFGWLYFLGQKMITPDPTKHFSLLGAASNVSYWDIGYGQGPWIWLWFRPLTIGVAILFSLLYLLKRQNLNKKSFFTLNYLMVLSLCLVHFSELVFYAALLFVLCLFSTLATQLRLMQSLLALLLALITLPPFMLFYDLIGLRIVIFLLDVLIPLAFVLLSFSIVRLKTRIHTVYPKIFKVNNGKSLYIASLILSVIWLAMLFYWVVNASNFGVWMVRSIFAVPWTLYPVLLGICGVASILTICHITKHHSNHAVMTFLLMFVLGILFGRLLTYFNLHVIQTGYWERRIVPLTFSASAILASIIISQAIKQMKRKQVFSIILLSTLVLVGTTSTYLSIDYQALATQRTMLTSTEQTHVKMLNELNPNSHLLSLSHRSIKIAEFAPFAWRIGYFRNHIWPATSPELVLNTLFSNGNPATIYLTEKDYSEILSSPDYLNGYMAHLLKSTPPLLNETNASIYYIENRSPPAENSKAILVLPENEPEQKYLYAYDIMSNAGYDYTTAYISDIQTLSEAEAIIVPNEILASKLLKLKNDLKLGYSKIIIFNLDGYYGQLAKINYPAMNISLISKDFCEAYIKNFFSQETVTEIPGADYSPFIIEVKPQNNSLILTEDNATGSWEPSAGLSGNISIPSLSNDPDEKISGINSLKIQVGNGSYAQWQLAWKFDNTTNLEDYDFISFYWYGRGDGTKYVIQANTETSTKYFWYQFTDDWKGWKKVIIPMHVTDGSYTLYGVSFSKVTKDNAKWTSIKSINFKLSGANLNVGGTFHMDRFAFEKAPLITLKAEVRGSLKNLQLVSLTSNKQVPIVELNKSTTKVITEYRLPDGTLATEILGEKLGNVKLTEYNSTYHEVLLNIKIPIPQESNQTFQAAFAINPKFLTIEVSTIKAGSETLELPVKVIITPYRTNANVTAYYGDSEVFFATRSVISHIDLIYLNFYPLTEAIENGSTEIYEKLGTIASMILENFDKYTFKTEPINAGNTAAFKQATLQGNVTAEFNSIIVKIKDNKSLNVIFDGQPIILPENVSSICPTQFQKGALKADYMRISPGKSFYINATLQNVTLNLEGNQTSLILLLKDGSTRSISGKALTLTVKDLNVLLRKPIINVKGKGNFTDLYTYHDLNKKVGALGVDCEIAGYLAFTGAYGDTYTIAKNFNFDGNVKLSKPLYDYDELKAFVETLPYLFIITLCYIAFAIIEKGKESNE